MKDFVDLQRALAAAELLHPHLDVIESALKKFEDLRNGGRNGLSEDEKEIAEQADREMHRLYQEKEREMRQAMTPLLNTLAQYETEHKRGDPVISDREDLRQRPTVALGARLKETQRTRHRGRYTTRRSSTAPLRHQPGFGRIFL